MLRILALLVGLETSSVFQLENNNHTSGKLAEQKFIGSIRGLQKITETIRRAHSAILEYSYCFQTFHSRSVLPLDKYGPDVRQGFYPEAQQSSKDTQCHGRNIKSSGTL